MPHSTEQVPPLLVPEVRTPTQEGRLGCPCLAGGATGGIQWLGGARFCGAVLGASGVGVPAHDASVAIATDSRGIAAVQ